MFSRFLALFGLLLCPLAVLAADVPPASTTPSAPAIGTPNGFAVEGVDLYLKGEVMAKRVSVEDLATYVNTLEGAAADYFAAQHNLWHEDLDIVVAVKPGPSSRVWLVSRMIPDPDDRLSDLRDKLAAVTPPPVNGGPIAFCINTQIAGGNNQPPSEAGSPPMPQEWMNAVGKASPSKPLPFDDMMALIGSTPPANTWDNTASRIITGGFIVIACVAAYVFYRRSQQAKRR